MGQNPYKPFENDKLDWLAPDKESAAPALSRKGGSKPAIILFIGYGDAEKCCARTFERIIFKDQSVVDLAKSSFITVRTDRESEIAKSFKVKGPEIVFQDGEGDEVARFIECTNAPLVLEVMKECLAHKRDTDRISGEWTRAVAKAEKFLTDGNAREACAIIARSRKEPRIGRALRDKLEAVEKTLGDKAGVLATDAKSKESTDPGAAWLIYRTVRDDYMGLPASTAAKAAMTALEKDPANKEKLHEARAESALDAARALANDGKKSEAIIALRGVMNDFAGTKAADDAKTLANDLKDPNWKPTPKAEPEPAKNEPAPGPAKSDPAAPEQPPMEPQQGD